MESQKDRGSSSPERDPQGSGWAVWKEFLRQKKIFLLFYKWRCVTTAEEAAPEALSDTISSCFYFLTANCRAATQTNTPAPPAFCPHLRAYWRRVPVTRVSLNPVSKHGRNVSPGSRRRSWAHKGVCELGIAPCVWECGVTAGRGWGGGAGRQPDADGGGQHAFTSGIHQHKRDSAVWNQRALGKDSGPYHGVPYIRNPLMVTSESCRYTQFVRSDWTLSKSSGLSLDTEGNR